MQICNYKYSKVNCKKIERTAAMKMPELKHVFPTLVSASLLCLKDFITMSIDKKYFFYIKNTKK